jgi:Raf kinase inhibitor-like YbhB/YbcL family protein
MKLLRWLAASAIVVVPLTGTVLAQGGAPATPGPPPLLLSTTAFTDGGVIPDKFTQASPTPVSPALTWVNTPAGTQSFTLIMHDPDGAPRKGTADTLHWIAFNIPATAASLPEGVQNVATLPDGTVQPNNSGGHNGFMGPGSRNYFHHYTIELYALDTKLSLGPDATRAQVLEAMDGHVIGKAAIEGRFHR